MGTHWSLLMASDRDQPVPRNTVIWANILVPWSHLSNFAPHFMDRGNQGWDGCSGALGHLVLSQVEKQETRLSANLLPVDFQHEVSTWKSLSKQTTHSSLTWLLRLACVRETVLEDITVMIITVVAFEGKYLFCGDCKTKNSRMLSSLCVQNKQNWDSDKCGVPFSLRNRPFASCSISQGPQGAGPGQSAEHPSACPPGASQESTGSLSVAWRMLLEGPSGCFFCYAGEATAFAVGSCAQILLKVPVLMPIVSKGIEQIATDSHMNKKTYTHKTKITALATSHCTACNTAPHVTSLFSVSSTCAPWGRGTCLVSST